MGIARNLLKGVKDKILKSYGEKIVTNLGDTSSDAPNKFSEPKRQLYEQMAAEGKLEANNKADR